MRVVVDHSANWLTLHEKGRGLFVAPFSLQTIWGECKMIEISYYIWENELLSYRCEN
jgi:hypothetical protein